MLVVTEGPAMLAAENNNKCRFGNLNIFIVLVISDLGFVRLAVLLWYLSGQKTRLVHCTRLKMSSIGLVVPFQVRYTPIGWGCQPSIDFWPVFTQMWLRYVRVFAVEIPSVVCLSVCNLRAPYSAGSNLRKYFYAILYPSHQLTSVQNFRRLT